MCVHREEMLVYSLYTPRKCVNLRKYKKQMVDLLYSILVDMSDIETYMHSLIILGIFTEDGKLRLALAG